MELKNRIWMNGALEWIALLDGQEVYLGKREVPIPLEEGDSWINELGDSFKIENGAIAFLGRVTPPQKVW